MTAHNITSAFPHPSLTPSASRPSYAKLTVWQKELSGNAASVSSHLGDGRQGHLALTISEGFVQRWVVSDISWIKSGISACINWSRTRIGRRGRSSHCISKCSWMAKQVCKLDAMRTSLMLAISKTFTQLQFNATIKITTSLDT